LIASELNLEHDDLVVRVSRSVAGSRVMSWGNLLLLWSSSQSPNDLGAVPVAISAASRKRQWIRAGRVGWS